jgi:16S rRNA C1402 N4-methylase RsmH
MELISGMTSWKQRPKTLARCFQALRIVVNDEMGALDQALMTVHNCLKPKGRLVVMSYHSLEDRRVKHLLRTGLVSSDLCLGVGERNPWEPLFRRAQMPTEKEIELNRRSRSAKLRVAERVDDNSEYIEYEEFADVKGTLWVNRDAPLVGTKQLAKLAKKKLLEQQEIEEDD